MIAGQKIGKLTAIAFKEKRYDHVSYWTFKCDCGKITISRLTMVVNGQTRSCGCLRKKYSKVRL
jgi:Staphylococcus phage HNH endonuclease